MGREVEGGGQGSGERVGKGDGEGWRDSRFIGVCYYCQILEAMHKDSGISPSTLRVDGRMTENAVFMQLQADIVGLDVGEQPCDTV